MIEPKGGGGNRKMSRRQDVKTGSASKGGGGKKKGHSEVSVSPKFLGNKLQWSSSIALTSGLEKKMEEEKPRPSKEPLRLFIPG
jgi:hypothetical protein